MSEHKPHSAKSKGPVKFQLIEEELKRQEKAVVVVPVFGSTRDKPNTSQKPGSIRPDSARLEEAIGLARAIDLDIVHAGLVPVKKPKPSTLLGTGKVLELAGIIKAQEAGLVVVDHPLTPVQQHKLEEAWNAKVLDRTGLILEIFGARAQTKEGRLQVELAHLNYQKGRLVRSWTHLERQRGGLSFVGGPGETQIESDRRQLQERIGRLENELAKVRKTRQLHRTRRQKVPHPVVALVGYTNAGKSTLFNRLTKANVMAEDQLFATLDPTLRKVNLPEGTRVIFSDTVGFISDLPTHLIAAFRATLEEVVEADLILHVRDIAQADSAAQASDVEQILAQLDIKPDDNDKIIEVWNKIDLVNSKSVAADKLSDCDEPPEQDAGQSPVFSSKPIKVSALTGQGISKLLTEIEHRLSANSQVVELSITGEKMGALPWIYQNTHVIDRIDSEAGTVDLKVRVNLRIKHELDQITS